ncbi:MAG: zinc-dependent metalloprotease, partial [Acidobacteriota bacterium]|nr:zinc-dependent metalloprotease [Acidobacteriota bacterium]
VVGADGGREVERSNRVHLLGHAVGDRRISIGLSLDPDGSNMSGVVSHPQGMFEIVMLGKSDIGTGLTSYEVGIGVQDRLGMVISTSCETADVPVYFDPLSASLGARPAHSTLLHQATVAFDTDGELLMDMFSGSTSAANTAIGDFVTAANVLYERDLGLRLVQGTTFLNTDPDADPWTETSTDAQLDEFGAYWEANRGGVARVFAAFLSGKGFSSPTGCSGAGIAWVDIYCDPVVSGGQFDGGSYSATQVLKCVPLNGSSNVNLIGHELGHNAGSGHTHCYTPVVDECYNAQSGCYAGTPACPDHTSVIPGITADKGTVMSYCNFGRPSGADCGASEPFFHPTVSARIKESITANTNPGCVTHACSAGSNDLPVSGNDTGAESYTACNSITFSNYTSSGTVTATAPSIIMDNDVTIGGTFTADNSVP